MNSYMGLFSQFLNIRPWEMELLTESQFNNLCPYVDKVKALIEQGMPIGM